ncbi:hypothetical protein NOV72_01011 [Caballeronia novacaledonica]|uniref:DUF3325 domain-containing protein n=1 Tax=Caballeronia novacaledonica TaxID=1544861 RepID=A0A2U3I0X5_9BURK|nr:DUF3325 domain-containing protein [Caballeronia novacaledonica]SPB13747.1 hypothetical protein NOV72_01011 [Caballeronia novacaledonica]
MTHFLCIVFCVMAFTFLAVSMDRHQMNLFGGELRAGQSRGFRIAGWCGLVLALRFIVGDEGWALGLVTYSGCTSLAAGLVYGGLIAYERFSAP